MWTRRAIMIVVSVAAIAVVHACKTPTQVTLDIRSTNDCSALRGVNLGVAGAPTVAEDRVGAFLTAAAPPCEKGSLSIGTLVVTPGPSGRAAVIVVAGVSTEAKECTKPDYKGCVVARRALSFVEGSSLVVPITIDFACKDVPCNVDTTCKNGECISSELDCNEEGCTPKDPRGRDEDGGTSVDAARDATNDGTLTDGSSDSGQDGSAQSDASVDVTVPSTCPHKCPFPGGPVTCPMNDACCYFVNGSPTCMAPETCYQGAGSRKPGVAACCVGSLDCGGAGTFCCAKYTTKSPFAGVATCFSKACANTGEVQLCDSDVDCGGKSCVFCNSIGFDDPTLRCCQP